MIKKTSTTVDIQNPDYTKEQVEVNSHCVSFDSYLSQHHPLLQFIRIWHLCGAFREPLNLLHCTRLDKQARTQPEF